MPAPHLRRLTPYLIAAGLLVLVLVRFGEGGDVERPLSADEREYLIAAGNILRYGTYSDLPITAGPAPPPTARRPPAYPLLVATTLALPGGHTTRIPEDLETPEARKGLGALRWTQVILLWLTACMSFGIVRRLVAGHRWPLIAAGAAAAAVALDGALQSSAHRFLSESLALPLLLALSWSLMIAVARSSRMALLAAGASMGALVLTRPLLVYATPILVAIVVWGHYGRGAPLKRAAIDVAIFLAACAPPVLGWMTRNAVLLDRFFIAEGAGLVAGMRAELNGMTGPEYLASALQWSGSRLARERLLPRMTTVWTGDALARADRDRFARVMERRDALRRTHRWPQADAAQAAEAMRSILDSPDDHIRLIPLMLLRGCGFYSSFTGGLLLVLGAFWAAARALRRREIGMVAFLSPAMTLVLLNALLTHGIPRYTLIAIPIFWCALAWLLSGAPSDSMASSPEKSALPA